MTRPEESSSLSVARCRSDGEEDRFFSTLQLIDKDLTAHVSDNDGIIKIMTAIAPVKSRLLLLVEESSNEVVVDDEKSEGKWMKKRHFDWRGEDGDVEEKFFRREIRNHVAVIGRRQIRANNCSEKAV